MPTYRIREGADADVPRLIALDDSVPTDRVLALRRDGEAPEHAFGLHWQEAPGSHRPYGLTEARLRADIAECSLFLVAETGEAVGYLLMVTQAWNSTAEIRQIVVDSTHRRRGIGSLLVDRAAEFTRANRLRAVTAETQSDNAVAVHLYIHSGFRLAGFNDRFYTNRDDERHQIALFFVREIE